MATGLSDSNPGIRWMQNPSDLQISTPFSQFGGLESKRGKNEFYLLEIYAVHPNTDNTSRPLAQGGFMRYSPSKQSLRMFYTITTLN